MQQTIISAKLFLDPRVSSPHGSLFCASCWDQLVVHDLVDLSLVPLGLLLESLGVFFFVAFSETFAPFKRKICNFPYIDVMYMK